MPLLSLNEICIKLRSGKSIPSVQVSREGLYPVIGGNGLRGYASEYNFDGECAVIGRQGAACGNVRYFSGKCYMTEHAVIAETTHSHNARYLAYLLSMQQLGRLSVSYTHLDVYKRQKLHEARPFVVCPQCFLRHERHERDPGWNDYR